MRNLKLIILMLVFTLVSKNMLSQAFDLTPMYGWQMNGDVKLYEGEMQMDGAQMFGGTLDIMVAEGMGLRLQYSYCKAPSEWVPYYGYEIAYPRESFDVINDYYQIGAIKGFSTGKAEPYGLFTMGAARFKGINNDDIDSDSRWKFALTAGLGCKVFFNERIGLKLEGAFMMPIYFAGVGFYFGTGGSGASVNGAVPLLQGNFNGGLVIRISK
ncbi:MAG: hypothetical protein U0W24_13980 [Bacteroidales bacterium]